MCDSKILDKIFENFPQREYRKGQIILHQGDPISRYHRIIKGYIKVYTISDSGQEHTVLILGPGFLFPVIALIDKTHAHVESYLASEHDYRARYFYESLTDVVVKLADRQKIIDALSADPKFVSAGLNYMACVFTILLNRLELLESPRSLDKLHLLLEYLTKAAGTPIKRGVFRLDLKLSHQELANLVGLTRETTSIQLGQMEKAGVIRINDGYLEINTAKLQTPETSKADSGI
ncbi:Crp/Fnr family transcriptional regulator [Candidatus Microgenomates bacterium]|nr:Crp/Fnr family transcriptional regulator [Candidatus Microgenomates bacterium]